MSSNTKSLPKKKFAGVAFPMDIKNCYFESNQQLYCRDKEIIKPYGVLVGKDTPKLFNGHADSKACALCVISLAGKFSVI